MLCIQQGIVSRCESFFMTMKWLILMIDHHSSSLFLMEQITFDETSGDSFGTVLHAMVNPPTSRLICALIDDVRFDAKR